jgi:hypothetical protein
MPYSKIVARIQYFGRNCNPETKFHCEEGFHNSDYEDLWVVTSCRLVEVYSLLQEPAVCIFRATLCNWQCNA